MNKQVYYEEQRLEGLLADELYQFGGAPSLSPMEYEDAYGLRSAPRTEMTMPAGVWATQLDVGYGRTADGMMGRPGASDFLVTDASLYLALALAAYLLFKP